MTDFAEHLADEHDAGLDGDPPTPFMSEAEYAEDLKLLIRSWDQARPRSLQSQQHKLGVSDIGGCPEYARRMILQFPFTDSPGTWAAVMGTATHHVTKEARAWGDAGVDTDAEVVVRIPLSDGRVIELTGHPDAVDFAENSVTDDKSVDGTSIPKRHGPEDRQRMQVGLYGKGCVDKGLLEPDPLIRLVWLDRSGRDPEPVVWQQQGYDGEVAEATAWLEDVLYAILNDQECERTPAIEWCAKACHFYTGCRLQGDLPDTDVTLADERYVRAVDTYVAGRVKEREGKAMKEDAKRELDGAVGVVDVSGRAYRVRWNHVNEVAVAATTRKAHRRLDIRPVPNKGA